MGKRLFLFAIYFVATFGVLNLAFPITDYFKNEPNLSRSYIVSSFLLLTLTNTLLAAAAFPFSVRGKTTRWVRVARTTGLYFALISMFAIACSGLGFGLSLGDLPFFGRLGFFFMEWEWLRFIFESALPLAVCAGMLYFVATRPVTQRHFLPSVNG
jgi:hypothetical protein